MGAGGARVARIVSPPHGTFPAVGTSDPDVIKLTRGPQRPLTPTAD